MIDIEGIEQAIMLDCLGQFEVIQFNRNFYWLYAWMERAHTVC